MCPAVTEKNFAQPPRLIYTGGTIGCAGTPFRPLPGPEFRALCERAGIAGACRWEWTASALDSAEMGPADWLALARHVLADEAPVVLLHGTDTMAWTAAALAFLLTGISADGRPTGRRAAPVVLTGAQRPIFPTAGLPDPASDGPANIAEALAAAADPAPGVRIAFGGRILSGPRALKTATLEDAAFAMPNEAADLEPLLSLRRAALGAQTEALSAHLGRRAVICLPAVPGAGAVTGALLDAAMDRLGNALGAVHLLGFGLGTLPRDPALVGALGRAAEEGVLVALGSQVLSGPVDPATYGAGAWALAHGVVPTGDMIAPAVQAKLHLILALASVHGWALEDCRRVLAAPLAGESSAAG